MSYAPRTSKPESVEIAQEPIGPIASDSLAADSIHDEGEFSNNKDAVPLGVRGDQSTLNNTDTSGASILPSAADGSDREEKDELGQGSDVKGVAGLKYPEGAGEIGTDGRKSDQGLAEERSGGGPIGASDFGASTLSSSAGGPDPSQIRSGDTVNQGTSSSSGADAGAASVGSGEGPAAGTGVRPHVDAAPNYVTSVTGTAMPEGTFKPKGANLEDAGQTGSMPETKTFTGAVGTVNDPGRLAERNFEGRNDDPVAQLGGAEDGQAKQKGGDSQDGETGQFGVLQSERA